LGCFHLFMHKPQSLRERYAGPGQKVILPIKSLEQFISPMIRPFSLNPEAMKDLVRGVREAEKALGRYARNLSEEELGSRQMVRRSIAARLDIKKGDVFNRNNLKLVRPGTGIHPRYFEHIQGKKALKDIEKEDLITWEMIG